MVNWRMGGVEGGVSGLFKKRGGFMKYQIKNNMLAAFLFSLSVSAIKTHSHRAKAKEKWKISFDVGHLFFDFICFRMV